MSKKSRARRKEKRAAEKARRKAANRARYAGLIGTRANRKSAQKRQKERFVDKHRHLKGLCGNLACRRCHSNASNNPWLAPTISSIYGKRWSSPLFRCSPN